MNSKMNSKPVFQTRENERGAHLSDYQPLLALLAVSALAALAASLPEPFSGMVWMHYFMGFFLCIFAMLKLFHPKAFANGFEMYDLLAKRFRGYAYVYPYIELGLGLAYLSFTAPYLTYVLTIIVLSFGAAGVLSALRKGLDINCPCMGTVLDVPLSTVTLTEDLGMAAMALMLILMRSGVI
ncbi:conserved hypothetical protein [Hahella chejuensis KCTC 2396]|uniref:Methylamine utilization protein MauE n=1 Tax=Hahella chejuensis (strain KCTC 2396) TaxID=349521 RepID=Q2SP39_HAHCH|nr:MauE/DoxX family redox-associated membrane protein [Hahella chejuensis]ABC27585.1 conserved hypothetical protein [Hahella chejuensis KCTC 2396]